MYIRTIPNKTEEPLNWENYNTLQEEIGTTKRNDTSDETDFNRWGRKKTITIVLYRKR